MFNLNWVMQIYLDSSATTAPRSEVVEFLPKIFLNRWGNPSSLHFAVLKEE